MPNPDEDREEQLILLAALLAWFKTHSKKLAQALRDDVITLAAWLAGMRFLVRRLHASAALIAGEFEDALVSGRVGEQYNFLDGFAGAIQDGDEGEALSVEAITARAALYAGAGTGTFWSVIREQEDEAPEVRWNLTPAEHCTDCLDLDARGWMPVEELGGQVPGDGQTICITNCRCYLDFR